MQVEIVTDGNSRQAEGGGRREDRGVGTGRKEVEGSRPGDAY